MEDYLSQLERTILHAATTGSPDATRCLDVERSKSSDGLAGICMELLRRHGWGKFDSTKIDCSLAKSNAVTFYALTTLQRSPLLQCICPLSDGTSNLNQKSSMDVLSSLRLQVKTLLIETISHYPSLASMPPFFTTKVGVLLALFVREEYPMHWTHPFSDVLNALNRRSISVAEDVSTTQCNSHVEDLLLRSNTNSHFQSNGISTNKSQSSSVAQIDFINIDFYLRFLDAISDEIVYPSAETDNNLTRNMTSNPSFRSSYISVRREQVKDVFRGFAMSNKHNNLCGVQPVVPLEQTDGANIICWFIGVLTKTAIENFDAMNINKMQRQLEMAVRTAATLKRYLSWIDIRLATHARLVQCLLHCLGLASLENGQASNNQTILYDDDAINENGKEDCSPHLGALLAAESANCLREIVTRGMEEEKKVTLIRELGIFERLHDLAGLTAANGKSTNSGFQLGKLDITTVDATQIEAVIAAAELINATGLELIPSWELEMKERSAASITIRTPINQCLDLAFACLAYDDIDVSGAVVDLITRVLVSMEKNDVLWSYAVDNLAINVSNTFVCQMLSILHERMKYPPTFNFDYEDEDEAEEEIYRTHLRKLYQRIVRFKPQLVLQYIGEAFSTLIQPLSSAAASDIEAILRLVHHYGEGRRPPPGATTALGDSPFRNIVLALHCSDVSFHPHREVLLLYYDLSVRYATILKECPEHLSNVLNALSGHRGLQHSHPRVRSRCCYFLLRLIKSVDGKTMRLYTDVVVDGIQNLLFPSERDVLPLSPNDALFLFECTGILLGSSGLDIASQRRCLTAVLTPHILRINQTLQSHSSNPDVELQEEQLSMSISAIAQLSKGWQSCPAPEVQTVLKAAVDVCHNVLVAFPSSMVVRSRVSVLLQRMILCLGEGILPLIPEFLKILLCYCANEQDALDISQLMNQSCIKFKEKAAAAIDSVIIPFLHKVLSLQQSESSFVQSDDSALPPHVVTEQLSIRKQAFSSLQHLASHNVSSVLYSERNVGSFGDVLHLMYLGAVDVPDPIMKKTCTLFFSELTQQWGQEVCSAPKIVRDGFFDFIYDVYVPGMFRLILKSDFNLKDAQQNRVFTEFCSLICFLKQSYRGNLEFNSRIAEPLKLGAGTTVVNGGVLNGTCSPLLNIAAIFERSKSEKEVELYLRRLKEGNIAVMSV